MSYSLFPRPPKPVNWQKLLIQLLPSLTAGVCAWIVFVFGGGTPILRASALALVIAVFALGLRPMGFALAVTGALVLAFSPAYWAQTGGRESFHIGLLAGTAVVAIAAGGAAYRLSGSLTWTAGISGLIIIGAILLGQVVGLSAVRSLRLTTLLTAALLVLLIEVIHRANPRPDTPSFGELRPVHFFLLLAVFAFGVINDPLIALFAPALILGLLLSRAKLPPLVWVGVITLAALGAYRLIDVYFSPFYWNYPPEQAIHAELRVPYLIGGAWREPARWLRLFNFMTSQFTVWGMLFSILGLARLARWYPPVGVVTLVAFGSYTLFGLLYFGGDASVLLLPLLMIQTFWMTYAAATLISWILRLSVDKPPVRASS